MKLEIYSLRNADREEWGFLENQAQHQSIFQTYSWAKVLSSIGTQPEFLTVVEKDSPVLGLLLSKSHFVSGIFTAYESLRGPLAVKDVEEDVLRFFLSELKRKISRSRALYFNFDSSPFTNLEKYFLEQHFLAVPSATFVVDLSPSEKTLWTNLEGRARRAIKKAQRSEVNIVEARNWEDWKTYYDLYVKESYRKHIQPHPITLLRSIYDFLLSEGKAKLYLAEYQGKVISGIIFLQSRDEMVGYKGISDIKYIDVPSANAVHWHAICKAKEQGVKYYDLGGTMGRLDKKHFLYGIHLFKRQWGGRLYRYNSFAINRFFVVGRNLFFANSKIRRLYYALEKFGAIERYDRA